MIIHMIKMIRKIQLSTRKQYLIGIPNSFVEIMELKKGDKMNIRYDRTKNIITMSK